MKSTKRSLTLIRVACLLIYIYKKICNYLLLFIHYGTFTITMNRILPCLIFCLQENPFTLRSCLLFCTLLFSVYFQLCSLHHFHPFPHSPFSLSFLTVNSLKTSDTLGATEMPQKDTHLGSLLGFDTKTRNNTSVKTML